MHWPNEIKATGELRHQVAHLIDLMPTFVDVAHAEYPKSFRGHDIQPMEGQSLRPYFNSHETTPRTLYWEHEGNRAIRDGDWKLVGQRNEPWELYNVRQDRTELNNLANEQPARFQELKANWDRWADKVNVLTPDEFEKARKAARRN